MQDGREHGASTARGSAPAAAAPHGGRLAEARRLFPGAPEPILDLSTGINPVPYPLPALEAAVFTRLPEPEAIEALEAAACASYGVALPDMVVAAPGTQILISALPLLLRRRRVAVLGPTYGEHAASWRSAGSEVSEVTRLQALEGADCAVLCNPNNPDGGRTAPADLMGLADRLARRGGLLVVDEAFADLEPPLSVAPALPHPGLLVLRSFGKTYGLAGVRLGFALADTPLAARIRAALGPWAVSGAAAEIGRHALTDTRWRRAAAARLQADAARLDALLSGAGLQVVGGTSLFRLGAGDHAPEVFERLGRAGIFVRRFPWRRDWLRFGLPGTESSWRRLAAALAPSPSGAG